MESLNDGGQRRDGLVFGDVGGWISGPSLDASRSGGQRSGGQRFGLDVGAWMKAYPSYILQGGFDGFGFICWRRSGQGRKSGQPVTAATLDDLAVLVDHRERHADKPADDWPAGG